MPLTIYSSSAGSGKTHTLAREYLSLLISKPEQAQQILAVTFTNKATGEMKNRVVRFLFELREGRNNDLAIELANKLNSTPASVAQNAGLALSHLLHHFSDLRIMTIDKFFQQVIRTFARDFDLSPGFSLELDTRSVIDQVLTDLYGQIGAMADLRKWLEHIVESQIEAGKNWNFRDNLSAFANEIFKEQYQQLDWQIQDDSLAGLYSTLVTYCKWFEDELQKKAMLLNDYFAEFEQHKEFLEGKSRNTVFAIWKKLMANDHSFVSQAGFLKVRESDYDILRPKVSSSEVLAWASELMPLFNNMMDFFVENQRKYASCQQVKKHFAPLAITRIILHQLQKYKQQNDVFLLAEAQFFLNKLIGNNDASFLFEKAGNNTKHFLIDEFQDTSMGQWNSFLPLVINSLSQNNHNLLVGDVKQSIYRFRGGDMRLLLEQAEKDVASFGVSKQYLQKNWRSKANIVSFNNAVFKHIPVQFQQALVKIGVANSHVIDLAYADAEQDCQAKNDQEKGFVQLHFPEKPEEGEVNDVIAEAFIQQIKHFQDLGYKASQLAVLVNKNSEGALVASWLAEAAEIEKGGNYCFDFISSDSLLLGSSLAVQCLISGLKFVADKEDIFSFREYLVFKNKLIGNEAEANRILAQSASNLLNEFEAEMLKFKKLRQQSLSETIARLLLISQIHQQPSDLQFLQLFIDQVYRFSSKESNDLYLFLQWWQTVADSVKLSAPDGTEAITIITIHKSKGLEFDIVLVPFASFQVFKDGIHANYFWTSSNESPFQASQPICVKSSSALLETYFSAEYEQEKINEALDSLNKTYVAFTRAKLGFIAWFPPQRASHHVGNFLKACLEDGQLPEHGFWDEAGSSWSFGSVSSQSNSLQLKTKSQHVIGFSLSLDTPKLRTSFVPDAANRINQNVGIAYHKAMSSIQSVVQLEALKPKVSEEIWTLLVKTIQNTSLKPYFDGSWTVRNERNLLLTDGTLMRPDRWQSRNGSHVLIDFKTGLPTPADSKQMNDYVSAVKLAGFKDVTGFLVYPNADHLVEIS